VLCGGEALSPALAERLVATGCRLINVYGPTETTIWSTSAEITGDRVVVGRPIANTVAHVRDPAGRPLPPGLVGELCLGGAGVARGYVRRPELTADRFRDNPVLGRHYRTGDLARWRRDGRLVLLGRRDRQVKLRAHRVELGEVEHALERHPEVGAAGVVLVGDPTRDGHLAAFVVAVDRPGLADDLWRHAAGVLPPYALPARITAVPALPQTANGKVDVTALGRLAAALPAASPATPEPASAGPTAALVALWRTVLGKQHLGEDSNFFLSGGTSLLAVSLAQRAGELLSAEVSLGMVFRAPTPAALARLLAEGAR
jgi:acyl-coenzyme A synthetase/AMP-(fatty) acid ligase